MTTTIAPDALAIRLREVVPDVVVEPFGVRLPANDIVTAAEFLRDTPELSFDVLTMQTAIDWIDDDCIELVYVVASTVHNTLATLKVRTSGREDPMVPSVMIVWPAAELQEREIYDLFGVRFAGHPDLRRLFLWDEFRGYPLRKDFLPLSQ